MKIFSPEKIVKSVALLAALFAHPVHAEIPQAARDAQIVILGEQHDNPAHHARQAEWVAALMPKALVFEMLTPDQVRNIDDTWQTQQELDALIGWTVRSDWPSFDMYFPIFAAAPDAAIYAAGVSRSDVGYALKQPLSAHSLAAFYGFDKPADPAEQTAREALQAQAHCNALPVELLPMMVDAQRLRDMTLAYAARDALRTTGGPVVVITGNGHARSDWGVPALIAYDTPDVRVFSLAQGEDGGAVDGGFSLTLDAPAPERGDPCAAFTR
jgi:uncharacterized iron-regulated protein